MVCFKFKRKSILIWNIIDINCFYEFELISIGLTEGQLIQKIIHSFDIGFNISNDATSNSATSQTQPPPEKSSLVSMLLAKHLKSSYEGSTSLDDEIAQFTKQKHIEDDALNYWKKMPLISRDWQL